RAVFVPLKRLQQDLEQPSRVNAILIRDGSGAGNQAIERALKQRATLEDYGLSLRLIESQQEVALEASAGLLDPPRAAAADRAAKAAGIEAVPGMTYLANTIPSHGPEVPYSPVTGREFQPPPSNSQPTPNSQLPSRKSGPTSNTQPPTSSAKPPIVINDWTARELDARVGEPLTLDYYVWREPGFLETRSADFRIAAIVPIAGFAADRDLAPVYPGITNADTLGDWDPPFPIDLKRVRPVDEDYWKTYRTTPKAFIAFDDAQKLWVTRYGDRTSVRLVPAAGQPLADLRDRYAAALTSTLDPGRMGLTVRAVRQDALSASRGATDFGEYFVYFSFFLVVSALVLAALFFRLGVEQRAREVGLLRAVGFSTPRVRRLFTAEGYLLAVAGSMIGMIGAVAYGALMMAGLRTWWSGAVGTTALTLHVSPVSLVAGAVGAIVAATICIWWTLRVLSRLSERALLAGTVVRRT